MNFTQILDSYTPQITSISLSNGLPSAIFTLGGDFKVNIDFVRLL